MLAVFLDQQVHCILRDGYLPDGCLRLRPGEHHLPAGVADVLLADGDCLVFCIQVRPEERHQLALAQPTDQLQVEHGQDVSGAGGVQVGLEVFWQERLHLHLLYLGGDAVIGRVAGDEPLFYRSLECTV